MAIARVGLAGDHGRLDLFVERNRSGPFACAVDLPSPPGGICVNRE